MLAAAIIALRFLQYSGAMILLGSSLFFLYGLPGDGRWAAAEAWPKRLLTVSAALLLIGAILGLVAQTGLLAGSFGEGFKPENLAAVITQMNFGIPALVRAGVAAFLLLSLIVLEPSRRAWTICAAGGGITCASFAWMGHGAATDGPAGMVHLAGDIVHSLAAGVWIGALVSFVFLLLPGRREDSDGDAALHDALRRFSGIGSIAVALVVLTGLVNSWFLIGPGRWMDFWTTLYGQVLVAKLLAFSGMLILAASNRWRLTPALGRAVDHPGEALAALRRSLVLETLAGFAVMGLVAWLGTLPPPSIG